VGLERREASGRKVLLDAPLNAQTPPSRVLCSWAHNPSPTRLKTSRDVLCNSNKDLLLSSNICSSWADAECKRPECSVARWGYQRTKSLSLRGYHQVGQRHSAHSCPNTQLQDCGSVRLVAASAGHSCAQGPGSYAGTQTLTCRRVQGC